MKKILWAILYIIVFVMGFVVGMISDKYDNKIVITHECTGQGVQKTYSAIFESRDGVVIRDEKIENATYTTSCLCWASDRTHTATVVAETEFSSNDESELHNTCDTACAAWCEYQLADFKFAE